MVESSWGRDSYMRPLGSVSTGWDLKGLLGIPQECDEELQAAGLGRGGFHELVPRAPAHLELRHLLLQVKDELLYPGVIGLIVVEFFLLLGSKVIVRVTGGLFKKYHSPPSHFHPSKKTGEKLLFPL